MAKDEKRFVYEGGVRFEVTPYGLICCLEETHDKKHECPDCKFCQWCSQVRCSGCYDHDRSGGESDEREG